MRQTSYIVLHVVHQNSHTTFVQIAIRLSVVGGRLRLRRGPNNLWVRPRRIRDYTHCTISGVEYSRIFIIICSRGRLMYGHHLAPTEVMMTTTPDLQTAILMLPNHDVLRPFEASDPSSIVSTVLRRGSCHRHSCSAKRLAPDTGEAARRYCYNFC